MADNYYTPGPPLPPRPPSRRSWADSPASLGLGLEPTSTLPHHHIQPTAAPATGQQQGRHLLHSSANESSSTLDYGGGDGQGPVGRLPSRGRGLHTADPEARPLPPVPPHLPQLQAAAPTPASGSLAESLANLASGQCLGSYPLPPLFSGTRGRLGSEASQASRGLQRSAGCLGPLPVLNHSPPPRPGGEASLAASSPPYPGTSGCRGLWHPEALAQSPGHAGRTSTMVPHAIPGVSMTAWQDPGSPFPHPTQHGLHGASQRLPGSQAAPAWQGTRLEGLAGFQPSLQPGRQSGGLKMPHHSLAVASDAEASGAGASGVEASASMCGLPGLFGASARLAPSPPLGSEGLTRASTLQSSSRGARAFRPSMWLSEEVSKATSQVGSQPGDALAELKSAAMAFLTGHGTVQAPDWGGGPPSGPGDNQPVRTGGGPLFPDQGYYTEGPAQRPGAPWPVPAGSTPLGLDSIGEGRTQTENRSLAFRREGVDATPAAAAAHAAAAAAPAAAAAATEEQSSRREPVGGEEPVEWRPLNLRNAASKPSELPHAGARSCTPGPVRQTEMKYRRDGVITLESVHAATAPSQESRLVKDQVVHRTTTTGKPLAYPKWQQLARKRRALLGAQGEGEAGEVADVASEPALKRCSTEFSSGRSPGLAISDKSGHVQTRELRPSGEAPAALGRRIVEGNNPQAPQCGAHAEGEVVPGSSFRLGEPSAVVREDHNEQGTEQTLHDDDHEGAEGMQGGASTEQVEKGGERQNNRDDARKERAFRLFGLWMSSEES